MSSLSARTASIGMAMATAARRAAALIALLMPMLPPPAAAHTTSEAFLTLEAAAGTEPTLRLDIALRDLDEAVNLDADGNGELTWGELRGARDTVAAYVGARVKLAADGQACSAKPADALQVIDHGGANYAVFALAFDCPVSAPREVALEYRLFAEINPRHRALFKLQSGSLAQSAVLDPLATEPPRFELASADPWRAFVTYVGQGVWHIWIGIDHIFFLVALLLPAVLWREAGRWRPAGTFKAAFVDVLKIVTAFTLAHSITLTLATLGWVRLPSRPVESAIAASVVLAAANNVWPLVGGRRWLVAFVFGLVHGFGFAGALAELGLPQGALALSLFGFNLGVEFGQMAIVAIFLPLAYALRATAFYRRVVLVGGSLLIVALASVWFVERAFGLQSGWLG